jgi:hypothetical protein
MSLVYVCEYHVLPLIGKSLFRSDTRFGRGPSFPLATSRPRSRERTSYVKTSELLCADMHVCSYFARTASGEVHGSRRPSSLILLCLDRAGLGLASRSVAYLRCIARLASNSRFRSVERSAVPFLRARIVSRRRVQLHGKPCDATTR